MSRRASMLGVVAGAALLIGGCGDSEESSDSGGGASGGGDAAAFTEKANKTAAAAASEIKPTVPTEGPKAETGKTIVTIPCSAAAQGCKIAVDWFKRAADDIGWKTVQIDPAGDPNKMADAVNRAVSIKADGIFTVAIDAGTIQAPLRKAKEAGLFATCFSCVDEDGLLVDILPAEEQHGIDGYNLAAQAYVENEGKLRMILLRDNEFGNTRGREEGVLKFMKECKDAGGDCEVLAEQNVLVQNINTSVPQQTVSTARQHPDWNALVAPYDAILTTVIPALKEAGLTGENKRVYGFDPIDINVDWIRNSDVETATVASPYRWIAYAAVDQLNRAFAGEEAVDQGIKDKLITKDNAPPEGETYLDDGDPSAAFKKIWGG